MVDRFDGYWCWIDQILRSSEPLPELACSQLPSMLEGKEEVDCGSKTPLNRGAPARPPVLPTHRIGKKADVSTLVTSSAIISSSSGYDITKISLHPTAGARS